MKLFSIVLSIFFSATFVHPQIINGRFSTSLYSFERIENQTASNTYLRSVELLSLNVVQNNFAIKTSAGFEYELAKNIEQNPRVRFYTLFAEYKKLFDVATLKLGRQPLIFSFLGGSFDGASIDLKIEKHKLFLFFGATVPAYNKLELIDKFSDNSSFGAKFSSTLTQHIYTSLYFFNKDFASESYTATRLDDNLMPYTLLIEKDANQFKYLGGEILFSNKNNLSANFKYEHDLNFKKTSKIELFGNSRINENFGVNLYVNYRKPKVRYNSYFSIFKVETTKEIEAGIDYSLNKNFSLLGKYGIVQYSDDNSQRIALSLNSKIISLDLRKTFGYAGELTGAALYSSNTYWDGVITASLGVDYSKYKLSEVSPENTALALYIGVNYRPLRELSFDCIGQYVQNKIYKNDSRILIKANYWFSTNLGIL